MMTEVGLSHFTAIFQLIIKYIKIRNILFPCTGLLFKFLLALVSSSMEDCSFFKACKLGCAFNLPEQPFFKLFSSPSSIHSKNLFNPRLTVLSKMFFDAVVLLTRDRLKRGNSRQHKHQRPPVH